jgi:DNA excision repair protein ERCC-8
MGGLDLPRSLPMLLARRLDGEIGQNFDAGSSLFYSRRCNCPRAFMNQVARQLLSPRCLLPSPQIVTPHTTGKVTAINSIHVDRVENRFLLAGGNDAVVSVFDLSKWGSEEYLAKRNNAHNNSSNRHETPNRSTIHKPIATSQRERPMAHAESDISIPSGHASTISKVQWYPVDSGAFLSASKDGCLLVWDTDSMTPVARCLPFADTQGGIATFHLSPSLQYSAVVASLQDPSLKLVDIRSGSSSHTLLGHAHPGVTSVNWSPLNDVILTSGGVDGTVRLWDIRKAGSRACLAILDQDRTHPPSRSRPYQADYSHLPKPSAGTTEAGDNRPNSGKRKTPPAVQQLAPNNYRMTENSTATSHSGPVTALSFVPDGHYLVSTGQDGNLHIWDLRANGHLLPRRFLAPGQQPAISKTRAQVPLLLTPFTCWVGNGSKLLGYSFDRGGVPENVLQGHLHTVTTVDVIEATMQLVTAGNDGMILTWGKPDRAHFRKRRADQDNW